MKVTIDHLVVVKQDIELPDTCPNKGCDVVFEDGAVLQVWEYQDQGRQAVIEGEEGLDWPTLPESGESWLYISWACRECETTLAEHNVKYFALEGEALPKPPTGLLDLLNLDGN